MTGIPIRHSGDGIWDDGEWISWAWINTQIDPEETAIDSDEFDDVEDEQPHDWALCCMIREATDFERRSKQISPLWGRIGELYAAERFGLKLTRNNSQGHDGRLRDDFVEVKTITPGKRKAFVRVKRGGNFSRLVVVQIRSDHQFEARMISRRKLPPGNGGAFVLVTWRNACAWADPLT